MKKILIILIPILLVMGHSAKAEEMVTVRLIKNIGSPTTLHFRLRGDYFTPDLGIPLFERHQYKLKVHKGRLVLQDGKAMYRLGRTFIIAPKTYDRAHMIFLNGTPYLGAMAFRLEIDHIRPVNQLPMEDYLKGVVPFEVFPSWHMEALKAQALAARTYAASHLHREIVDTIQDQVYGGYLWNPKTTKAVEETKGEVITYHGRLIDAFYSASNGGVTENNAHVWGGENKPFYPIKKDPYDPKQPWQLTFHQNQIRADRPIQWSSTHEKEAKIAENIKQWLRRQGYGPDIKILDIPRFTIDEARNASGRALTGSLTVTFLQRFHGLFRYEEVRLEHVSLKRIRPIFGGDVFKSYLIDDVTCRKGLCTVKGRGYGHGVGMSQWGASRMGERGKNYKEIIQFYFPGTDIRSLDEKKVDS